MKLRNKILIGAMGAGMGLTMVSCSDFLATEKYMEDEKTEERVFDEKTYTMEFLTFVYNRLQGDNVEIGHSTSAPPTSATTRPSTRAAQAWTQACATAPSSSAR